MLRCQIVTKPIYTTLINQKYYAQYDILWKRVNKMK